MPELSPLIWKLHQMTDGQLSSPPHRCSVSTTVLFVSYTTLVDIKTDDWGDDTMLSFANFLRHCGLHVGRAELRDRAREALQRPIDGSSEPTLTLISP